MPELSIIIPIYCVEKYIAKCLASIYNSNVAEELFEVIAVNDGTPDNSMEIVEKYSRQYNNLHSYSQSNQGVSAARNLGIEKASGRYVTFVDPDDWIAPDGLETCLSAIRLGKDAEITILQLHFSSSGAETGIWSKSINKHCTMASGADAFKHGYSRGCSTGCIYQQKFLSLHNIRFPIGVTNGEDTIFFFLCQAYANLLYFHPQPFYVINTREESASRKKVSIQTYFNAYNKTTNAIQNILRERTDLSLRQQSILNCCLYRICANTIAHCAREKISYREFLGYSNILAFLPIPTKYMPYTFRIKTTIFNLSTHLFYILAQYKRA